MAKKGGSSSGSFLDLLHGIDNGIEILSQAKNADIKDYIDTGNYMLNAAMTASLFKGVPAGRVTVLAGDPGTGKSYLALSVCRNAQKKGYYVIYIDTEGAQDRENMTNLGIDPERCALVQLMKVSEVSTFLVKLCKGLEEKPEEEREKIIIVLDSLGDLTSDKEYNDIAEGNGKTDMTRAKEIKAMFRTNATPLARLGIPLIVCAHIYYTQDFMPKAVVSGGSGINFNASITVMLTAAKLEDKANDEAAKKHVGDVAKKGILVSALPKKSRFAIPQKVKFQIPFFKSPNPYVGLENYVLDWDKFGVMFGKVVTAKEYDKLSETEKKECYPFEDENGATIYAQNKPTARTIVVKHLHGAIDAKELWSSKVFTEDVLRRIDEEYIQPNFKLPAFNSSEDIEELVELM